MWICEFCGERNEVNIDDEEIPKTEAINYILEAAPIEEKKGSEEKK